MIMVGKRSNVGQADCFKSFLRTYNMLELLKRSCPLRDEDCYRYWNRVVSPTVFRIILLGKNRSLLDKLVER